MQLLITETISKRSPSKNRLAARQQNTIKTEGIITEISPYISNKPAQCALPSFQKHIKTKTSAINVVIAAPYIPKNGTARIFKKTLINALAMTVFKQYFSSQFGTRMTLFRKLDNKLNGIERHRIFSEIVA